MAEKEYTRLTRGRRRVSGGIVSVSASSSSLWLGRDHLLCIDSSGFSEEYKRFYFRDIQAFVLRRDARQLINAILLGLPLVCFLLGVVVNLGDPAGEGLVWFFGVIVVILAPLFGYNLFAGPTVKCSLQTAVQTELLPPLNRLRRANKIINRLRPVIAAEQGEMSREEISERLFAEQVADVAAAAPPVAEPPPIINP